MSQKLLAEIDKRWVIELVVAATAITGGIAVYGISQFGQVGQNSSSPSVETTPTVKKVAALGRLEPEAGVIHLSAPMALDGDRLAQLLVKEGDEVKAGQVVAIFDSRDRLRAAVRQAVKQLSVTKAKLAQVKAGAKAGEIQAQQATITRLQAEQETEIEAQKATVARLEVEQETEIQAQKAAIARLEAELGNAQVEYQRHQMLYLQGAISASLRDSKLLAMQTAQQQLNEARANLKRIQASGQQQLNEARANLRRIQASRQQQLKEARANLNQIAEVRPTDVQAAQAEIDSAQAAVERTQTDLEQAYVRAPMAGRILKIHTRTGEKIAEAGIVDLAQTDQMMAVAEVYQSDIGEVQPGQQVVITGQAFAGEMRGVVSQIGLQVGRQNVFSNQPGENLDGRVVEVKIRLNPSDSQRVAGLTNLQVQTAINTELQTAVKTIATEQGSKEAGEVSRDAKLRTVVKTIATEQGSKEAGEISRDAKLRTVLETIVAIATEQGSKEAAEISRDAKLRTVLETIVAIATEQGSEEAGEISRDAKLRTVVKTIAAKQGSSPA